MMLSAQHLHVDIGHQPVLVDVTAEFGVGWTAIVGPNGAGKSTLLRTLAGLIAPRLGEVRIDGLAASAPHRRERATRIAWLDQQANPSGELSVRETVALGRLAHLGLTANAGAADDAAVDEAMRLTGCAGHPNKLLGQLSGGERQRVLLARALATQAPILLLDEPTTHLDPPFQVGIARLLRQLATTRTVVSVVHDLGLAFCADRVLAMQQGKVVAHAAVSDPTLHRVLSEIFEGAIEIQWHRDQWIATYPVMQGGH
jgi:iron complex transport system ATP-binding protein